MVGARRRDGTVVAWGTPESRPPAGLRNVVALAAGDGHLLALDSQGRVTAWGVNDDGQTDVPPGLSGVMAIAAGRSHSVALRRDGSVVAWGRSDEGQTDVPPGVRGVTAISALNNLTLAMGTAGPPMLQGQPTALQIPRLQNAGLMVDALGFGLRYQWFQGRVPVGPPSFRPDLRFLGTMPRPGAGSYTVTISNPAGAVSSGPIEVTLVDPAPGTVIAWHAAGETSGPQAAIPPGLSNVIALAPGWGHVLALTADGTVRAWGNNPFGEARVPKGLRDVIAVDAHFRRSVALKADGTVMEWGFVPAGRPADGLGEVMAVAAGMEHSMALLRDGTVVAWGSPWIESWHVPLGLRDVIAIDARAYSSVALLRGGAVVDWYGAGDPCGSKPMPQELQGVESLFSGWGTTLARTFDSGLVAWGGNCSRAAEPPATQNFVAATATRELGVGLRANGSVVMWGRRDQWVRPNIGTPSWGVFADEFHVYEIVGPPVTPRLYFQSHPNHAVLVWHAFTGREVLHAADRLDAHIWRPVAVEPGRFNRLRRLEIPDASTDTYYRLQELDAGGPEAGNP